MTLARDGATSSAHAADRTLAEEGWAMHMATKIKRWTLEELHSLPDDGNKYELVRGQLFVTPPPNVEHETVLARLSRLLEPFVAAHGLGFVYHPRSVLRVGGSEVEPDLMVRQRPRDLHVDWDQAPVPILVVEVSSDSTRRRDHRDKRELYAEAGVDDYWIVDPQRRVITVAHPDGREETSSDTLAWAPRGAAEALVVILADLFAP
jgi:Uma2 family endonuclease